MTPPSQILRAILVMIAAVALVLPILVVRYVPAPRPVLPVAIERRVVAATELPAVEPVKLQDLAPQDAQAFNAAIPFVTGPNPAARPFTFSGSADDLARATDCLAAAGYYEAGDDSEGQRAVDQVILNRLRHPAFPKTVCGVVFQGSERSTGCQFTFTCDGALARTPSEAAWRRARETAAAALSGAVYKPVGYATHYHTDWVVPYWSASLDKIAELHTHLFFRWTGWWGTPPAFNRTPQIGEMAVAKLARLSTAHGMGAALADADGAIIEASPFFGRLPLPLASEPNTFLTSLNPAQSGTFAAMALAACGEREKCKFMGWTDPGLMGFTLPLGPEQMAGMSFSYIRDRASGLERSLWNCGEFRGKSPCMKRQVLRLPVPAAEEPAPAPVTTVRGPAELDGVRRKAVAEPPPAEPIAKP